ncbi:MAG: hypothetical protein AAGN46_14215 [Acidobacteriota bacterium]
MIKRSDHSQRKVEQLAGFSKGYLSQLLAQNLDIKVWHVLAILEVFDLTPTEFFARVYDRAEQPADALDRFVDRSEPLAGDVDEALLRLYHVGLTSLSKMRRRLERCEQAMAQLERRGLVDLGAAER